LLKLVSCAVVCVCVRVYERSLVVLDYILVILRSFCAFTRVNLIL
jgi:hypothetical protein